MVVINCCSSKFRGSCLLFIILLLIVQLMNTNFILWLGRIKVVGRVVNKQAQSASFDVHQYEARCDVAGRSGLMVVWQYLSIPE